MAENQALALTIVSLAGFQLLGVWNTVAPSMGDLRDASPQDKVIRQKLIDADIMVGGTALILGGAVTLLTHNSQALCIMLALFGSVSLWHHAVLNRNQVEGTVEPWL